MSKTTLLCFLFPLVMMFTFWFISKLLLLLLEFPKKAIHIGNIRIQGLLPYTIENELAKCIDQMIASIDKPKLENWMATKGIDNLMPMAEIHVDVFLTQKLPEAMPMIGMLIGERTTQQLKEIFLDELKTLFPTIMIAYYNNAESTNALHDAIMDLIQSKIDSGFKLCNVEGAIKKMQLFQWLFVVIGFITGMLLMIVALLIL